jgi:hypothetical protein
MLDPTKVAGRQYTFSEKGMGIMNWVQVYLCVRDSYQQLRGLRLLVIGCHT